MLALGVALGVLLLTSVYAKPQQRAIPATGREPAQNVSQIAPQNGTMSENPSISPNATTSSSFMTSNFTAPNITQPSPTVSNATSSNSPVPSAAPANLTAADNTQPNSTATSVTTTDLATSNSTALNSTASDSTASNSTRSPGRLRMPDSVRFDNITVEREGQARVRAFQETSRAGQGMRSVVRVGPDGPPRTTMETIAGRPALPMPTVFGPPPTRPGPPVEPGLPPMTTAPAPFPTEQRLPLPTMADLPPLPTAPGLVRFVPLPAFSAGGPPEHREFFASIQRNIDETERRIREWQANF
ncbi:mucin-2-like isoform X4 [Amphibalanus amphitrite]|nr:mucin-2-like isoform X4 [Amphibalanus amphitrite]